MELEWNTIFLSSFFLLLFSSPSKQPFIYIGLFFATVFFFGGEVILPRVLLDVPMRRCPSPREIMHWHHSVQLFINKTGIPKKQYIGPSVHPCTLRSALLCNEHNKRGYGGKCNLLETRSNGLYMSVYTILFICSLPSFLLCPFHFLSLPIFG